MMTDSGGKTYRPWNPEHYRYETHSPEARSFRMTWCFLARYGAQVGLGAVSMPPMRRKRWRRHFDPQMMVCLLFHATAWACFRVARLPRRASVTWRSLPLWARIGRTFARSVIFASSSGGLLRRVVGGVPLYRGRVGAGEVGQCIDRWDQNPGHCVSAQSHELRVYEERSRAVARRDRALVARLPTGCRRRRGPGQSPG